MAGEPGTDESIISGHDLERWLLKCLKAMAVSGNLHFDGHTRIDKFHPSVDPLLFLEDVDIWPNDSGLVRINNDGEDNSTHNYFHLAPLTNQNDEIYGLYAEMLGVQFILTFVSFHPLNFPININSMVHRPGAIDIIDGEVRRRLWISWEKPPTYQQALQFTRR